MDVESAVNALIGAGVGSIVALLGTLATLLLQFRTERDRWAREDRQAAERAEQEAAAAQHARDMAFKEHLTEIYTQAIAHTSEVASAQRFTGSNFQEAQKWLSLVSLYHYDKGSIAFQKFQTSYRDLLGGRGGSIDTPATHLRSCVIQFLLEDPRLQDKPQEDALEGSAKES